MQGLPEIDGIEGQHETQRTPSRMRTTSRVHRKRLHYPTKKHWKKSSEKNLCSGESGRFKRGDGGEIILAAL